MRRKPPEKVRNPLLLQHWWKKLLKEHQGQLVNHSAMNIPTVTGPKKGRTETRTRRTTKGKTNPGMPEEASDLPNNLDQLVNHSAMNIPTVTGPKKGRTETKTRRKTNQEVPEEASDLPNNLDQLVNHSAMNIPTVTGPKKGRTETKTRRTTRGKTNQGVPGEASDLPNGLDGKHAGEHQGRPVNASLLNIPVVLALKEERIETRTGRTEKGKTNQGIPEEASDLLPNGLDGKHAGEHQDRPVNASLLNIPVVLAPKEERTLKEERTETRTGRTEKGKTNQGIPEEASDLLPNGLDGKHAGEHQDRPVNASLLNIPVVLVPKEERTETRTGRTEKGKTNQGIPEEARSLLPNGLDGKHAGEHRDRPANASLLNIPVVLAPKEGRTLKEERTETRIGRTEKGKTNQEIPEEARSLLPNGLDGKHAGKHRDRPVNASLLNIPVVLAPKEGRTPKEERTETRIGRTEKGKTNQEIPEEARSLLPNGLDGKHAGEHRDRPVNASLLNIPVVLAPKEGRTLKEEQTETRTGRTEKGKTNQEIPEEARSLLPNGLDGKHAGEHRDRPVSASLLNIPVVLAPKEERTLKEERTETRTGRTEKGKTNQKIPEKARSLLPNGLDGKHAGEHRDQLMNGSSPNILTMLDPRKKRKKLRTDCRPKNETKQTVEAKNAIRENSKTARNKNTTITRPSLLSQQTRRLTVTFHRTPNTMTTSINLSSRKYRMTKAP